MTVLLDKLSDRAERDLYAAKAVEHGWSRNVLLNQTMKRLHEREAAAPSNFTAQLPPAESEVAQQLTKDPCPFDFLHLTDAVAERDLDQVFMDRLQDALLEMGRGFAFVGRQVRFDVDGDEFVDLLLFHVTQLRYVVVELKIGKFQPDYTGRLGFYVALVEDELRDRQRHCPTVGILLWAGRNERVVRCALSGTAAPVAIADYTYDTLPAAEQTALPAAAELTARPADRARGKQRGARRSGRAEQRRRAIGCCAFDERTGGLTRCLRMPTPQPPTSGRRSPDGTATATCSPGTSTRW